MLIRRYPKQPRKRHWQSISALLIFKEFPKEFAMRYLILLLSCAVAACATTGSSNVGVSVETISKGQLLAGASCIVTTNAGSWTITTPATVAVGSANGDLRVICNKAGYRTSEVVYRSSSPVNSGVGVGIGGGSGNVSVGLGMGIPVALGGGGYPSRIAVEMNPQ
jgi:hypothetical protein